jgi:hypothetical protein
VIPQPPQVARNWETEPSISSLRRTRVAPWERQVKISSALVSNVSVANCSIRSAAVKPKSSPAESA